YDPEVCSQNWAMRSCSVVRWSEIVRNSASATLNSDESREGGGGGRNSAPLVRKNGRISPSRGKMGGWELLTHLSLPVGTVPFHARSNRSVFASATTSPPAVCPTWAADANSSRDAPGPSAAVSPASRASIMDALVGNA